MATKMNKLIRETIVRRLVDDVKRAREPLLRSREHALALRLTRARYGDDVFTCCRALPEGWLTVHKEITLAFKLYENLPHFNERDGVFHGRPQYRRQPGRSLSLGEFAPLPNSFAESWDREELGGLYDEVYAFYEAATELYRDLEHLATQAQATLNAFTTIEKLNDGWPEGFALIPAEMLEPLTPKAGLPAPRIEDLNRRIAALKEAA